VHELELQRARRARVSLLIIFAANGLIMATWASRIPAVKDAAGLSVAQLGGVLLAPALGALLAFELSGRAAARYGTAPVTAACAVAFCAVLPLIAVMDASVWTLVATLLIFGAGNGGLDVAMNSHGVAVETALGRPALSGMHAAFSAGGLIGAAAGGGAAAAHIGIGIHFSLLAVLGVSCALVVMRWLPLESSVVQPALEPPPIEPNATTPFGSRRTGLLAIVPGPVLLLGAVGFACLLGEGASADWSAAYMRGSAHSSAGVAAAAYAGFSAAMLGGRIIGDRLRARFRPGQLLTIPAVAAAAGLLCGLAFGGPAAGIAGFTLFGGGLAIIIPIIFHAAGNLPERRTGMPAARALARVNTLSYLGFLAGPPIVGAIASATGLRFALVLPVTCAGLVAVLAKPALSMETRSPLPLERELADTPA
jgi:MFS family permease